MRIFLLLMALAGTSVSAQDTRTLNRGDRNTSISASAQTNLPRSQRGDTTIPQSRFRPANPVGGEDRPDVLLDVPYLAVDSIGLKVNKLTAKLSLDARVANLVSLKAGVDLSIDTVQISVTGVRASALLIVRLDNVREIIDKTLTTIDKNPQILDKLLSTVDNTVNTVGDVANTALQPGGVISQTVNTLGQTVQRTVDAAGNIVEKTLDSTGKVLSQTNAGRLLDLPVISQTTNAAGQLVKRVRDSAGAVIEFVQDSAGKILSSRVVSGATK